MFKDFHFFRSDIEQIVNSDNIGRYSVFIELFDYTIKVFNKDYAQKLTLSYSVRIFFKRFRSLGTSEHKKKYKNIFESYYLLTSR